MACPSGRSFCPGMSEPLSEVKRKIVLSITSNFSSVLTISPTDQSRSWIKSPEAPYYLVSPNTPNQPRPSDFIPDTLSVKALPGIIESRGIRSVRMPELCRSLPSMAPAIAISQLTKFGDCLAVGGIFAEGCRPACFLIPLRVCRWLQSLTMLRRAVPRLHSYVPCT